MNKLTFAAANYGAALFSVISVRECGNLSESSAFVLAHSHHPPPRLSKLLQVLFFLNIQLDDSRSQLHISLQKKARRRDSQRLLLQRGLDPPAGARAGRTKRSRPATPRRQSEQSPAASGRHVEPLGGPKRPRASVTPPLPK